MQHIPYLLDVCRGVAARAVVLPDAVALEAVDELLDVRGLDGTQLLVSNRGLDDRVDDARILGVGDGLQGTEFVVLHPCVQPFTERAGAIIGLAHFNLGHRLTEPAFCGSFVRRVYRFLNLLAVQIISGCVAGFP